LAAKQLRNLYVTDTDCWRKSLCFGKGLIINSVNNRFKKLQKVFSIATGPETPRIGMGAVVQGV